MIIIPSIEQETAMLLGFDPNEQRALEESKPAENPEKPDTENEERRNHHGI